VNSNFRIVRRFFGPLFLILACPVSAILMWYTMTELNGSIAALGAFFKNEGVFQGIYKIWAPVFWGSKTAWSMIGIFAAFQLFLMKAVPAKEVLGPITPKGNVPKYKDNGLTSFAITLVAFVLGAKLEFYSLSILYDKMGELLGALNVFSLVFCLFLYLKGRYAPSSTDNGHTDNFVFDYYWGTELYPRVLGWDIKQFTNCRMGMMSWPLFLISYAAKQDALYGITNGMLVAVLLQLIYVGKFFKWERGYLRSLDIMHDRAGFYICWGCLVWVPAVYTSPTLFLVKHPIQLSSALAVLIIVLGVSSIMINYFADRQRQKIRESNGNCKIWGRNPVFTIASYTTSEGEKKESILLASGWWGLARHFHYVPEILGAFFWTLPAMFGFFLPYFYVIFLTVLLLDRAFRDDERCQKKYGKGWDKHCELVPHKILPKIF
jgi:7-dehydrocholesterol reductase